MPDTAPAVTTAPSVPPVDLAGLIPEQRAAETEGEGPVDDVAASEPVPSAAVVAPERLAFLWTLVGALVGAVIVAGLFLALMALLP